MEMLIEKYERYLGTLKRNQKEMEVLLLELGIADLNRGERDLPNQLMDTTSYTNICISLAERAVDKLKKKMDA